MQYVKVQFLDSTSSKKYLYRCLHDVNVGDMVVVQANNSYGLATVTDAGCQKTMAVKDVICVVDMSVHNAKAAVADEIAAYEQQLDERLKVFRRNQEIQQMVSQDTIAFGIQNKLAALRLQQALGGN